MSKLAASPIDRILADVILGSKDRRAGILEAAEFALGSLDRIGHRRNAEVLRLALAVAASHDGTVVLPRGTFGEIVESLGAERWIEVHGEIEGLRIAAADVHAELSLLQRSRDEAPEPAVKFDGVSIEPETWRRIVAAFAYENEPFTPLDLAVALEDAAGVLAARDTKIKDLDQERAALLEQRDRLLVSIGEDSANVAEVCGLLGTCVTSWDEIREAVERLKQAGSNYEEQFAELRAAVPEKLVDSGFLIDDVRALVKETEDAARQYDQNQVAIRVLREDRDRLQAFRNEDLDGMRMVCAVLGTGMSSWESILKMVGALRGERDRLSADLDVWAQRAVCGEVFADDTLQNADAIFPASMVIEDFEPVQPSPEPAKAIVVDEFEPTEAEPVDGGGQTVVSAPIEPLAWTDDAVVLVDPRSSMPIPEAAPVRVTLAPAKPKIPTLDDRVDAIRRLAENEAKADIASALGLPNARVVHGMTMSDKKRIDRVRMAAPHDRPGILDEIRRELDTKGVAAGG